MYRTVIFWGAGATASLGMPTTADQGKMLFSLLRGKESYADVLMEFKDRVWGDRLHAVADLLTLLDDGLESPVEGFRLTALDETQQRLLDEVYASDFGQNSGSERERRDSRRNRLYRLRLRYDWSALMQVLQTQRFNSDENGSGPAKDFILNLYSEIDKCIADGVGMHVSRGRHGGSDFLDVNRVKAARNALVMFTNLMFACAWNKICGSNPEKLEPYKRFFDQVVDWHLRNELNDKSQRKSVSFVSMNFDPLLFWMLKNAIRRKDIDARYVCDPPRQIRLCEIIDGIERMRSFEDAESAVEYAPTLSFVSFYNSGKDSSRHYVPIQIYYPHGCTNIRTCPSCGHMSLYQGNEIGDGSGSLFPPFFINELGWKAKPKDKDEINTHKSESEHWENGERDYLNCLHCGRAMRLADTEMVMQSGLKSCPSFNLQKVQRDVDLELQLADHVVLMGYSLPRDDLGWIASLQMKSDCKENKCTVVDYLATAPVGWIYKFGSAENLAVRNAIRVFGKNNVRANFAGIPKIFDAENFESLITYK